MKHLVISTMRAFDCFSSDRLETRNTAPNPTRNQALATDFSTDACALQKSNLMKHSSYSFEHDNPRRRARAKANNLTVNWGAVRVPLHAAPCIK